MKVDTKKVPKLRFHGFSDEWRKLKLNEVASVNPKTGELPSDFIYIDLDSVKNGRLLKQNRISKQGAPSRAQRLLQKNDIIFQTVRPYQKNNFFFGKDQNDVVASTGYAQIRAIENPHFLYQLLHTGKFVNDVLVRSTGTNYPAITSNDLAKISLHLPTKEEQDKIASILSVSDEAISNIENQTKLLKQYKNGAMQVIFSQKIRFKGFSNRWQNVTLGGIGRTYNGLQGKTAEDFGEGKPYITYNQIFARSSLDVESFGKVEVLPNEKQNTAKKGDIFFTTSSETPEEAGYASVLLHNIEHLYLNSFCFGYRITKLDKLLPEFAQFLFRDQSFRKKVVRLAQGSTRYNLSKTELMKVEVDLPEIAEQKYIANYLISLDDKIDLTERQLEQAKLFKKALLQQMFTS